MKTKITTVGLCILMGVSALVFNGCKGKDGAPGAQGPAGVDGNANVVGSTSVVASNWTLNSGILYSTTLTWTSITQVIVDKGVVMVYESDGSGGWQALPYSFISEENTFGFDVGFVNIYITQTDGSAPTNPGSRTYRLVTMTSRAMQTHPNLDLKNYSQVKEAFNLKD